jgi:hypothetical protein
MVKSFLPFSLRSGSRASQDYSSNEVNKAAEIMKVPNARASIYESTTRQYVFNWSTKGLPAGTYQLQINHGDGVTRTVNVGLK